MSSHAGLAGTLLDFDQAGASAAPSRIGIADGIIDTIRKGGPDGPDRRVLMAPLVNAHDHVRAIRPIALGAFDMPLELWLTAMTRIPPVDPALVATVALGRQVLGGCGGVMIHYTRPRDPARVAEELETVAAAARAIGVRVAIAVAMRDRNPLGYGVHEAVLDGLAPADRELIRERLAPGPEPAAEQIRRVDDLADRIAGPLVDVQYGPYGPEWCSRDLLAAIAARSADTGRRVHMHLMESRIQREYLDHEHDNRPIHHLDALGLLSPRLSVAHAVWLRPDEIELLSERGVTVCTNASSNLSLRNGQAAIAEMARRGVRLAIGLDGFSVDDDDDAFRELRLNHLLHRGTGLQDGVSVPGLLSAACYGGRRVVSGVESPGVCEGGPGDLMEIDYGAMSGDLLLEPDMAGVVVHRACSRHLRAMTVAGRTIARDGALTGVDLPGAMAELDAQARHGAPAFADWRAVSDRLGARLRAVYGAGLHRCG